SPRSGEAVFPRRRSRSEWTRGCARIAASPDFPECDQVTIFSLMAQDALGNEVSGRNEATLRGIDDFVTGFLGYETKATNVLAAADADPDSVLANVYAGFTWMFLEAATAEEHAQLYLDRARAAAGNANPREQLLLDQLEHWIAGDVPAVQRIGDTIVDAFPRDLASV